MHSMQYDLCAYKKRHRDTKRECPVMGGSDWNIAAVNQEILKIPSKPLKAKDSYLQFPEGTWPIWYFDFGLLVSRSMRQ